MMPQRLRAGMTPQSNGAKGVSLVMATRGNEMNRTLSLASTPSSIALFLTILGAGCGGGGDTPEPPPPPSNSPPTADAGADQTVDEETTVTLDGSDSSDSDGTISSWSWTQITNNAPEVDISDSEQSTASFVAPDVMEDTTFEFELRIEDDDGASATDRIAISVNNVAKVRGISIFGLGDSILVTNKEVVTISGVANSDLEITGVRYENLSNDTSGNAEGTAEWTAEVTLDQGENRLRFSAITEDSYSTSVETALTYFPNLDFTTSLNLDQEVLFQGEQVGTRVIATIGTSNEHSPQLSLVLISDDDTETVTIEELNDNGVLPDEIEGDGVFTGSFSFQEQENGHYCYRVKVTDSVGSTYQSESECIWLTDRYTNEQIDNSVSLADKAAETYKNRIDEGDTPEEAARETSVQLGMDDRVAATGANDGGGVWWISSDGILGVFYPTIEGARSSPREDRRQQQMPKSRQFEFENLDPIIHYPSQYLDDRGKFVSAHQGQGDAQSRIGYFPEQSVIAQGDNRIGSLEAMMLSPFLWEFDPYDDYTGAWEVIKGHQSCQGLQPTLAKVNATSTATSVTLNDFANWGNFGYIHISSHGDNFFRGEGLVWLAEWGPDIRQGHNSVVGVFSGHLIPQNDSGEWRITSNIEADLKLNRLAISEKGSLVVLPPFFRRYLNVLPNSLVVVAACRSAMSRSLIDVLLSKGASAVVGYTEIVNSKYAQGTTQEIVRSMLQDNSLGVAIESARAKFGSVDESTGWRAKLFGAGNLDILLSEGGLFNGDFEIGSLEPWRTKGDGRIILQLKSTRPTQGKFMGIISTGLGFTTATGEISQSLCLPDSAKNLRFDWNFLSEEFLEYCGTIFDDTFQVQICVNGDCTTAFRTSVNELCRNRGQLSKADFGFDRGDVYKTGWRTQTINISNFAGKSVDVRFFSTDRGDSRYDTAILLDRIAIE